MSACEENTVCPVPGDCTGLLFLSELQSPTHCTHTCPCFHQGSKVRERNTGCSYLSSLCVSSGAFSTKHRWKAAGSCSFMRGCTSLLAEEVPISGSMCCCIELLVACDGLALASCQAPRQPLSALLNCTGGETTVSIKKLMG